MDFDVIYKVRVAIIYPTSVNEVNYGNPHPYAMNFNYAPT